MNGYFIWNLLMTLICTFNWAMVARNPYSDPWAKNILFFFMLMVMGLTAASYGA